MAICMYKKCMCSDNLIDNYALLLRICEAMLMLYSTREANPVGSYYV
jgi:hypothetical protein